MGRGEGKRRGIGVFKKYIWDGTGIYDIIWLLSFSYLPIFSRCKEESNRKLEIQGGKGMEVERERKGMK